MFSATLNLFRVKKLVIKYYLPYLVYFYSVSVHIYPVPGVDADVLKSQDASGLFGIFNTFAGGALQQFSVFAMGIMPYITASIVIQLMQMDVIPTLAEWAKQGEVGQKKTQKLTRVLAIVLSFIQALIMSYGFNNAYGGLIKDTSVVGFITVALVLTAGTALLLWIGDQISQYGVGNGVSIIILAGIIARMPQQFYQVYESQIKDAENINLAILN